MLVIVTTELKVFESVKSVATVPMVFEPSAATAPMSAASPATAVMFARLVEFGTVLTLVMFDATKDRLCQLRTLIAHRITVN